MQVRWQIFIGIEVGLLIATGWQIFTNPVSLTFLILGILSLTWANRRKQAHRGTFMTSFWSIVGWIALPVTLFSTWSVWLMLLVGLIFGILIVNKNGHQSNWMLQFPWLKKHFFAVEAIPPRDDKTTEMQSHQWFGNQTIGNEVFEWDDLNFSLIAGDTIIDLGNTILPKADNTIVLQKGFGKTRILVPVGTGVLLDHSALIGRVTIGERSAALHNQSVRLYSKDYLDSSRHLKITTNVLIGDLEVLFV